MEYEDVTEIECEGCGVSLAVHHDGCLINFCPACGQDIDTEYDELMNGYDTSEFDIY